MRDILFRLQPSAPISLQAQIREHLVTAICSGQLAAGERVPSSRHLASQLKVSRNTVSLAYQRLLDDGFLVAHERSGYYVADSIPQPLPSRRSHSMATSLDWTERLRIRPSSQINVAKPQNWHEHPYPFISGQVDPALFPIAEWRDCVRQALGRKWINAWTADAEARDDPMLIEQIRRRLLPARGIRAGDDEILVTLGAQHALYMICSLLVSESTAVAIENPGYRDLRNIFRLRTDRVVPIPLDDQGMIVDERIAFAQIICTTPSHQAPSNVTMSVARREALLAAASKSNALIVEDDYESETNFEGSASPALKAADNEGRVIYVGSLSKTLFPGLRLGFIVAPSDVIREARALRRLMVRHPPSNNQRTVALFLALGHHEGLVMRLKRAYKERRAALRDACKEFLSVGHNEVSFGGSSAWVAGPPDLDAGELAQRALEQGIVIEPGEIYFNEDPAPKNFFRLGFSSIDAHKIRPGIAALAELMDSRRP